MIALKAENISKQYRLGEVGTGTLSHDLNRWWAKMRGKEDPFLKIGEANDRTAKGTSDYVWALNDINFEIEQGTAVGIIGRNGAGKSTLLKLLSKVTKPTTGRIYTKGRIASLLEVGTGFHPEMTGRENIYLNGAILGMTRREITRKFDEIVDFAGVERYIDTPVKRYSSGMYVRLAFAVAAHLESEILIVDEVLAVGDAEFQKKCLGKMNDVSKGEGRTVLFVSHNMAAIKSLCDQSILLHQGGVLKKGGTLPVLDEYTSLDSSLIEIERDLSEIIGFKNEFIALKNIKLDKKRIKPKESFNIEIEYDYFKNNTVLGLTWELQTADGVIVFHYGEQVFEKKSVEGRFRSTLKVPKDLLNAGVYSVKIIFGERRTPLLIASEVFIFEITALAENKVPGVVLPKLEINTVKL